MDEQSADSHGASPVPLAGDTIIQFGIFCCAVALVIVLAVAAAAS